MAIAEDTQGPLHQFVYTWTSDSSGDATETTTSTYSGEILSLVTIPDGTAAPTDNYDVVVTDSNGVDILYGGGADRDTLNTEYVQGTSLGVIATSALTFTIADAGDTKEGTVIVTLR